MLVAPLRTCQAGFAVDDRDRLSKEHDEFTRLGIGRPGLAVLVLRSGDEQHAVDRIAGEARLPDRLAAGIDRISEGGRARRCACREGRVHAGASGGAHEARQAIVREADVDPSQRQTSTVAVLPVSFHLQLPGERAAGRRDAVDQIGPQNFSELRGIENFKKYEHFLVFL